MSEDPTEDLNRLSKSPGENVKNPTSAKTVHVVPGATDDSGIDYVTGWLTIIEGPGRGHSIEVGHGMNSIGRSPSCKISVNFGDDAISFENHANLIYDNKNRKFFLKHGNSENLSYVDDKPALSPVELKSQDQILIGKTRFLFFPFCGPDFSWEDVE